MYQIKGKNPTLLSVTYQKPQKKRGIDECFQVIYADDEGTPHYVEVPAEVQIWIVKEDKRNYTYNKPQEHMKNMYPVKCLVSNIKKEIAKAAGDWGKNIVEQAYKTNDYEMLNQLYLWPYAFGCDFQPEFYYMKQWYDEYKLETPKLYKSYLDIETDLMDYMMDMDDIPSTAYSPVNCVTVSFDDPDDTYTFILRPYKPQRLGRSDEEYEERMRLYENQLKQHEALMSDLAGFYNELHARFDSTYGHISYHLREYENEIDLIADIFRCINKRKPSFCLCWNMRFDIQYLYYRIITLGYDPASVICHPDFNNPKCYFKVDKSTYQLNKQYDYFYCSSYTQYICQMRLYASVRKSQHALRRVSLNAISDRELKDRKVDYPEESNIVSFPYKDWRLFIIYNIKDSLLQKGIEHKTKDVVTYYMRSHANLTPYNKIFRETHLLRNVREQYFEKDGWVQGNNINIIKLHESEDEANKRFYGEDDDKSESSFKGAINADPIWNDRVGQELMGIKTNNLFANGVDFDMGSFYPSIKIACNLDSATLLAKASFDNSEFISGQMSNKSLNQQYEEKDKYGKIRPVDITGEAVNTFASGNTLTMAYNYFSLPSISDVLEIVDKRIK